MVQNYMEIVVSELLQTELNANAHKYDTLCLCPLCLASIQCTALNMLKPFYTTSITGNVYGEFQSRESQHTSDIMAAIGKGISQNLEHPAHDL